MTGVQKIEAIGVLVALLALLPAKIARDKGLAPIPYFIFGLAIWPLAMLFVTLEKPRTSDPAGKEII